jgi:GTP cyclohydrolase I
MPAISRSNPELAHVDTEALFREFMQRCGAPVEDSHFVDTPKRVAKMYHELLRGYKEPDFNFTTFPLDEGAEPSLVVTTGITYYSLCSHHMVPFFGKCHIGYLPSDKLCGLSKLARTVQHLSAKLQVQERLTEEIADLLVEKLNPAAVAVVMSGEHLCMSMRGVKSPGHNTTTSAMRGKMLSETTLKDEFFKIVELTSR